MIESAFDRNGAAELVCQLARNVQSDAGAAGLAGAVILGSVKPLENLFLVSLANAYPGIDYRKLYDAVTPVHPQHHPATRRVLDGVDDEVLQ